MHVMLCVLAICASPTDKTPEQLVEQLGSMNFSKREQAAATLKYLDKQALPALKAGMTHEDVEIKFRCRLLVRDYCKVLPEKDGDEIPQIWSLPNSLRWDSTILPSAPYDYDVANFFYRELYPYVISSKEEWPEPPVIYLGTEQVVIAKQATLDYISYRRFHGATRHDIQMIYKAMRLAESTFKRMKHHDNDYGHNRLYPPSCWLTESVKEGEWGYNDKK